MNINYFKDPDATRRMWPELFTEGGSISLTNGEELINRYGKYMPQMSFLLNKENCCIRWEDADPSLNIDWDGDPLQLRGDYWVSKKGTHCFRPSNEGKHILVSVDWGGCFISTRGTEYFTTEALALYAHRASSNGGGAGYNFYVFPYGYHREVSIEDI